MAKVDTVFNDGVLTVRLDGHVDSANAAEIEKEITEARAVAPKAVVIDCEKLEYISSAGLRIILRTKKAVPDTKVVNVSPDVYEVFDVTGFTEMMDVQKAYRTIRVDGCEIIGKGANGTVYRIDPDTIVKAYRSADSLADIHRERELARKAFVLGVPTAIPFDVVRIEGGFYGSVFELLNAKSFAAMLAADPSSLDEVVRRSVELLKILHATELKPGELPSKKQEILAKAERLTGYLKPSELEKYRRLIEEVPDVCHMLHGDFHVKNVMVQNGESLLIDMDTLCVGHPIFEFGPMYSTYVGYSLIDPENSMRFLGIPFSLGSELWNRTIEAYFSDRDEAFVQSVKEKAMLVGFARTMSSQIKDARNGDDYAARLLEANRVKLVEYLDRVDSLVF